MKYFTSPNYWIEYKKLPDDIKRLADKNFELLKANPKHSSLHFKNVGDYWSVRIGLKYRALGINNEDAIIWFWIGTHADYDNLVN